MNGIEWMLTQVDKKEFEQPESDPVAWEEAQREYTVALLAIRHAVRRKRTYVERMAKDED